MEVLTRLALKALNESKRDRHAAGRLMRQWIHEDEALFESVMEPSINLALTTAINRDIGQERKDVLRAARAAPSVESGVRIGTAPPVVCIPTSSPEAESRRAARVLGATMKLSGYHTYALPETGKMLGEGQAWELKDACIYHSKRRDGEAWKAQFFGFLFQAHPDHDLPHAKQRKTAEVIDLKTIKRLDERAQLVACRTVTAPLGEVRP